MTLRTSVSAELEQIRKAHHGILRPKQVVAYARNRKTALYGCFEWNNGEAAREYRLEQARRLIRFTVTVVKEDLPPIHVYVSLGSDRKQGDSYRSLVEVMADADLRKQLLAQALGEAESWRKRYERLLELEPIMRAIVQVGKDNGVAKTQARARAQLGMA